MPKMDKKNLSFKAEYITNFTMNKKLALITGGAIRVGKAIVLRLAKEGYDIALHYNGSEAEAEETKNEAEKFGTSIELYKADLTKLNELEGMFNDIVNRQGKPSLLINNAAVFIRNSLMESDEADFDNHFHLNLKAPYFLTKFFAENCEGNIINISDARYKEQIPSFFAYYLTKKSLVDLTRLSAEEFKDKNIRVNAIALGTTDLEQTYSSKIEGKKYITLDEVTDNVIKILSSNKSGEVIRLNNNSL